MAIVVNLDVMMAKRKISSGELAEKIGITQANLSILKTKEVFPIKRKALHLLKKKQNLKNQEKNQILFHGKKTAHHSMRQLKDGETQVFTKNQKEKQKNSKIKDRQHRV